MAGRFDTKPDCYCKDTPLVYSCVTPPVELPDMNRFERRPAPAVEAEVDFLDGEYRVRRPGAFVRCAVTGEPIALEDLRYWSVDHQQAFSTPQARLRALGISPAR